MQRRFKTPISVLVVIHTRNLRVLLLERTDAPGFWQSVTGSQEDGETLLETASREVAEETGLESTCHVLSNWNLENRYEIFERWRHRYAPNVSHNTEHVFGLQLPESVPVTLSPQEHLRARWLPWEEAATLCFSSSNAVAIRRLGAATPR